MDHDQKLKRSLCRNSLPSTNVQKLSLCSINEIDNNIVEACVLRAAYLALDFIR